MKNDKIIHIIIDSSQNLIGLSDIGKVYIFNLKNKEWSLLVDSPYFDKYEEDTTKKARENSIRKGTIK